MRTFCDSPTLLFYFLLLKRQMSKRQPRTSKAKTQKRPMRTPTPEESEADDIEMFLISFILLLRF
jgi:hypothetical protein